MAVSISTRHDLARMKATMARARAAWPKASLDVARDLAAAMELEAKRNLRKTKATFRGTLLNSITRHAVMDGNNTARGIISSDLPYAGVIDLGRRPGAPPPPAEDLVPWVKKKLAAKGDRKKPGALLSLAFVVARSIGKKGIVGRRYMQDARDTVKAKSQKIASAAIKRFMDRMRGSA